MENLFFSVIVPTYKSKFLKECIDSVLSQTYSNFELIIVNDASPEDIDSIISPYSDNRIKYYRNSKNTGSVNVVNNWNLCLDYSVGDYLICMGDDDKLLPNCLEEYSNLIFSYPGMGVYHGWTEIIDENSNIIRMQEPRPIQESVYSLIWNRWLGRSQYIGDFLFDVPLLKKNGGFYFLPLAWGSDNVSSYVAAEFSGIVNSQTPVFQYRVNSLSLSVISNCESKIDAILGEYLWMSHFLEKIPSDSVSVIYWKNLKDNCRRYYRKLIVSQVSKSIEKNFLYVFIYKCKWSRCDLSFKELLRAIFISFKDRFKNLL